MANKRQDKILLPMLKAGFVHLLMFLLLLTSFQSISTEQPLEIQVKSAPIIKATAISSAEVEKLVKQKKQRIDAAAKAERDRKRRIRQETEKKKKAAATKKRKKAEAEKKRKADAQKKRKADAEKKRKKEAEEKRKKQQLEREMQAQLEAEQNAAKQQQILSELQKYHALIKNKISRNWIIANQTGQCILEVKLAAGGLVIDVREMGGTPAICRSAKAAVYKADPLPVSNKPEVFNKMRTLRLTLDPQEM